MTKRLLCVVIATALLLTLTVCGCTRTPQHADETSLLETSAPEETTAPVETAAGTEPDTEPADESTANVPAPLTEDQVLDALDGTWEMLPGGELLRQEPYATLQIDRSIRKLVFTRTSDGNYFAAHFSLTDLFSEGAGKNDLMQVYPDDISEDFIEHGDKVVLGVRTDFQIMLSTSPDGIDRLALREIGNGNTALAMEGFDYDKTAGDGYWIFERVTDEQPTPLKASLKKNETFYAFRWRDTGATCELQPMRVHSYEEVWYEDPETVLEFYYTDSADAMIAAEYTLKGKADMAHSGVYDVGMVRVTTDADGAVTAIEDVPGLGYGAYTTE